MLERILQLNYEIDQYRKAEADGILKLERVDSQLHSTEKKIESNTVQRYLVRLSGV